MFQEQSDNQWANEVTGANSRPASPFEAGAAVRTRLVRSTVTVGGCRSVLSFDNTDARPLNGKHKEQELCLVLVLDVCLVHSGATMPRDYYDRCLGFRWRQ